MSSINSIAAKTVGKQNDFNLTSSSLTAQGKIGGQAVIKMPSMAQLLNDMKEEISFAHSEKNEELKGKEEEIYDRKDHNMHQLIKRVEEKFPSNAGQQHRHKGHLAQELAHGLIHNQEELFASLEDGESDRGADFALLLELAENPPPGVDDQTCALLKQAISSYANLYEAEITASVNTLPVAQETVKTQPQYSVNSLQAAYQDNVVKHEGILPTLLDLSERFGTQDVENSISFLMRAGEAELNAETHSIQPERLQSTLVALSGCKIFNTIRQNIEKVYDHFEKAAQESPPFPKPKMIHKFLKIVHEPAAFNSEIAQPFSKYQDKDKVLFFQDLRTATKLLPDQLFAGGRGPNGMPNDKTRAIAPIQKEIDHLIYEEDA